MARSSRLTGWASQDRVEHGPGHAGDEAGPAAGLGPLEDGVDAAGQDTGGGPDQAPVPSQERALWARATAIVIVVAVSAGLAWVNTAAAKYCWVLIRLVRWAAERRSAPPSPSGPPRTPGP